MRPVITRFTAKLLQRRIFFSDLYPRCCSSVAQQLYSKIKLTGPITVAEYMKMALKSPVGGYYTRHSSQFGSDGDFVTSPELNQMFGELIGVWLYYEWRKLGAPQPFQIVELGPGRGTLMSDILRVWQYFGGLVQCAGVHLIEISRQLATAQAQLLCRDGRVSPVDDFSKGYHYFEGACAHYPTVPIKWYTHVNNSFDECFSLVVANEFFDALPIHKFQRGEDGRLHEILIDNEPTSTDDHIRFRYIQAREATPILSIFQSEDHAYYADCMAIEVSIEQQVICQKIINHMVHRGGISLFCDYGYSDLPDSGLIDTFRAFKKHQLHDPLQQPGTADLTADVDFNRMNKVALRHGNIVTFGPICQRDFLLNMGIEQRRQMLMSNLTQDQCQQFDTNYDMLIDPNEMGGKFKFFAMFPSTANDILTKAPVAGFTAPPTNTEQQQEENLTEN